MPAEENQAVAEQPPETTKAADQEIVAGPKQEKGAKIPVPSSPARPVSSPPVPAAPMSSALSEPGPALQKALDDGLRVTGTMTSQPETEAFGKGQIWKGRSWNIGLQLVNETPWALELGKDFFLYEADADFANINGVALFRGQRPQNVAPTHLMNLPAAATHIALRNSQ